MPQEQTFSKYNTTQAAQYNSTRYNYSPALYNAVLDRHTSTGGKLDTLLDVGTGPGPVARSLAPTFKHAIALDPSAGMIETARSLGGTTSNGENIRYEISTAEDLGANLSPPIPNNSIDLIVAGTAAHWFDMAAFWPRAAQLLRPGGSVALWCSKDPHADPSMPAAAGIQAAMDEMLEGPLGPYRTAGNIMAKEGYVSLILPWDVPGGVEGFDRKAFLRRDFEPGEDFYHWPGEMSLDVFEAVLGTSSPVTRWREAHPELVGTEREVIRMLRRRIEVLLREAGVEEGKETIKGVVPGALLVVKKGV